MSKGWWQERHDTCRNGYTSRLWTCHILPKCVCVLRLNFGKFSISMEAFKPIFSTHIKTAREAKSTQATESMQTTY